MSAGAATPSPATRYASSTTASATRSGDAAATGSAASKSRLDRRHDPAIGVVAIEAVTGLAPEPAGLDESAPGARTAGTGPRADPRHPTAASWSAGRRRG